MQRNAVLLASFFTYYSHYSSYFLDKKKMESPLYNEVEKLESRPPPYPSAPPNPSNPIQQPQQLQYPMIQIPMNPYVPNMQQLQYPMNPYAPNMQQPYTTLQQPYNTPMPQQHYSMPGKYEMSRLVVNKKISFTNYFHFL